MNSESYAGTRVRNNKSGEFKGLITTRVQWAEFSPFCCSISDTTKQKTSRAACGDVDFCRMSSSCEISLCCLFFFNPFSVFLFLSSLTPVLGSSVIDLMIVPTTNLASLARCFLWRERHQNQDTRYWKQKKKKNRWRMFSNLITKPGFYAVIPRSRMNPQRLTYRRSNTFLRAGMVNVIYRVTYELWWSQSGVCLTFDTLNRQHPAESRVRKSYDWSKPLIGNEHNIS